MWYLFISFIYKFMFILYYLKRKSNIKHILMCDHQFIVPTAYRAYLYFSDYIVESDYQDQWGRSLFKLRFGLLSKI